MARFHICLQVVPSQQDRCSYANLYPTLAITWSVFVNTSFGYVTLNDTSMLKGTNVAFFLFSRKAYRSVHTTFGKVTRFRSIVLVDFDFFLAQNKVTTHLSRLTEQNLTYLPHENFVYLILVLKTDSWICTLKFKWPKISWSSVGYQVGK